MTEERIKLLWDVCRIPDFQKLFNDLCSVSQNNFLLLVKNEKIQSYGLKKIF